MKDGDAQECADRFYWSRGPCCAGCDWWNRINSVCGECRRYAPKAAEQVISNCSRVAGGIFSSGHQLTRRDHHCGEFKDEFDWLSLPRHYLEKVKFPAPPQEDGG